MKNLIFILITLFFNHSLLAQTIADEEIVNLEDGKNWEAHLVAKDTYWQKPACIATTKTEDGLSSLEVIAFYDEATESFGEPMVHVITPFDVSFFEVSVNTEESSAKRFQMMPVILPNDLLDDGTKMIAARALFDEREDLVATLRRRNVVTAKYFDVQGETKSLSFSLRGSSKTILSMFETCALDFSELPLLPEALPELP